MRSRFCGLVMLACLMGFIVNPATARAQSFQGVSLSAFENSNAALPDETTLNLSRYRMFPCRAPGTAQGFRAKHATPDATERYRAPRAASVGTLFNIPCSEPPYAYFAETPFSFDGNLSPSGSHDSGGFDPNVPESFGTSSSRSLRDFDTTPGATSTSENTAERFHWWPTLQQSFNFLVIEHGFRIATDPFLRYLLWHKPFWHDWAASDQHFYMNHWGDGDDFLVNYIGHPLEGGVTGNIFIVNDPKGRSLQFGRTHAYWVSRLKAMAYSAAYSAAFEAGPILSESAIGNEGGYFYKPGCDPYLSCSTEDKKPITNNTGWVDFVITPLIGTGWIVLEDSIETEIVDRLSKGDNGIGWKILRASLSPSHVMANFVAGKTPWYRYRLDGDRGSLFNWHQDQPPPKFTFDDAKRWETGVHYTYLSLPVDTQTCVSCRVGNSGFGGNFAYRITNRLWVDSDVNYFPGSGAYGKKGSLVEGLFGPRYGYTGKSWGLYFKLRPGFIYYDKTLTADSGGDFTNATRFAFDVGSIFEWYTSPRSAIRLDAGTTVVRYLTGRPDPRQPTGNVLSTDYIVAQSNFQIATGYTYRF